MVLSETQHFVGTQTVQNPIFGQLLTNLTQYQNGRLQIRELRDEQDTNQTANNLSALSTLFNDVSTAPSKGVSYFVGVDFADNFDSSGTDNGTAATQASEIAAAMPAGSVLSFEIGNEPDLYASSSPARRTGTWNYTVFKQQYEQVVTDIEAKNTGIPMDAPVFAAVSNSWASNIDDFITSETAHLALFDLHYYAGNHCNGHSETADYLMTDTAINPSTEYARPNNVAGYLSTLHSAGRSNFRIGEMNSIACQGQSGVSDRFQSALWFMDQAFNYAAEGVSGINVFTLNATSYYSPFQFNTNGAAPNYTWTVKQINPIYYGMIMTAMMLQNSGELISATSNQSSLKAWATLDASNTVRTLLINKSESTDYSVSLNLSGRGTATLWQLTASNNDYTASDYTSGDQITLGGRTFKGSTDGTWQGTQSLPTVVPNNGVYTITIPHSSAVIIKVP